MAKHLGRKTDSTAGPGCPDPGKAYGKDEASRKRMIEEHNGYNVADPAVRREWTKKMLEKHGDSQCTEVVEQIDEQVMQISGAPEAGK